MTEQLRTLRYRPDLALDADTFGPAAETNIPLAQIWRRYDDYSVRPLYEKVTQKELPDFQLPRFKGKTWWLLKQTWTFQPEEMQDLYFQPAVAVFADDLGSETGYYVARNLARLGPIAVSALVEALKSTNPAVRIHAASTLNDNREWESTPPDSLMVECLPALFHDAEWEVRQDAAGAAGAIRNPRFAEPLMQLLRDDNAEVQKAAVFSLMRYIRWYEGLGPELVNLLGDENRQLRANAFEVLANTPVTIPRADVLQFLSGSDMRTLSLAVSRLKRDGVSEDELLPLRNNSFVPARLTWLRTMRGFQDKASVGAIIPLLRDPAVPVRGQAWELLQDFTGRHFPKEQPEQWEQWWAGNKTTFLIADYTTALADNSTNGSIYHDRGCLYYDTRNFAKALADFRKAGQLGFENADYSHFRIWLVRARLGEPEAATRELKDYLAQRPTGKDWPLKVGRFLAAQMSEPEFIQAAADPVSQTDREQHCEAWFYAGTKQLIAGDKAAARDNFQKCVATGVSSFEEYQSAGAELKYLASAAR